MPAPPTVTNAPNPPPAPADGDLWFNTVTGREYVWYISPSTTLGSWVQTQPSGGGTAYAPPQPSVIVQPPTTTPTDAHRTPIITVSPVAPAGPLVGDLWWSPVTGQQMVWYDDGNTQQWVISNYGAGKQGPPGPSGLPPGGLPNEVLTKLSTAAADADWLPLPPPIDLSPYALLDSPTFIGDPKAPTPTTADNDTSIATTAFVRAAIATYSPPPDLSGYAPLASPVFTGDPKAPTPSTADNDTSIATTAFVKAQGYATTSYVDAADALKAPLASPTFTGDPKAPTPTAGDNDTSIATTAFVTTALGPYATTASLSAYAPLASPLFTGDPRAPTPATADNDTSIATTAFVKAQGYGTGTLTGITAGAGITVSGAAPSPTVGITNSITAGSVGDATHIPVLTYNAQGQLTAVSSAVISGGGGASITVSDTAPGSPTAGALWWKSDIGQLFLYYADPNTSQWVPAAPAPALATTVPPGAIMDFAGASAPAGWLICDGSVVSRTTYAALFAAIGVLYGAGDGSTTFALPDLGGRVTAGKEAVATRLPFGATLGGSGGASTVALAINQMPSHTHYPAQGGTPFASQGSLWGYSNSSAVGNAIYYDNLAAQGSGAAHENTQPTIIMNKIIKT